MSLLTEIQNNKGENMTLTLADFPDKETNPQSLYEAFRKFPWFFIETFQTVKDVDGKILPFRLTKPQRYIEKACLEQHQRYNFIHLVILKGRQYRISTYCARRGLHFSLFNNHIYTIFANRIEDIAEEGIYNYVYEGYESLLDKAEEYPFLKPLLKTSRKKLSGAKLQFSGESKGKVEARTATKDAVGRPCQYAHITEASRIEHFADFWESFYPALHIDYFHQLIIESTARFTGPKFIEIFKEQWELEKEIGYPPSLRAIFIPPYIVDEYMNVGIPEGYTWEDFWEGENEAVYGQERDIAAQKWWDPMDECFIELPLNFMKWRRDTIQGMHKDETTGFTKLDLFKQSFPMSPEEAELIVGDNVFDRRILDKRRYFPYVFDPQEGKGTVFIDEDNQPQFEPRIDGKYTIWSSPEPECWYTIGADPAGGTKGDYSVAVVWSPCRNEVAARFRANTIDIHGIVEAGIALARHYNNAMLGFEMNYWGQHILKKLLGKDSYNPKGSPYTNLYTRKPVEFKYNPAQKNPPVGFWTDIKTKPAIVGIFQDLLIDEHSGLYSENLINELWFWRNRFNQEGERIKTPTAPKGKHDDEIMATGIAVYIARECMKRADLMRKIHIPETDPVKAYEQARERIKKERIAYKKSRQWNKRDKQAFSKVGVRIA